MQDIFTPEEAATPVTFRDLGIFAEEILPQLAEAIIKSDEATFNGVTNLINILSDRINEIEYKRIRDVYFFTELLSQVLNCSRESLRENYTKYCDEFDRLNKKE